MRYSTAERAEIAEDSKGISLRRLGGLGG